MAPKKGSKINRNELPRTPKGTLCQCGLCGLEVQYNRYLKIEYLVGHNRSGESSPERSLTALYPELAKEVYQDDPDKIWSSSGKKILWQAECGHIWDETPGHRVWVLSRGRYLGCPYCSGQRVLTGFNDLATTHPEIASEAYGWDPTTISKGMIKKLQWKCETCEYIWVTSPNGRTGGKRNSGCPQCSNGGGFDASKPGYLYLMHQPDWGLTQIGITNYPQKRLATHKKSGWHLVDLIALSSGLDTRQIETSLKHWLRSEGIPVGYKSDGSKFDGYTESWPVEEFCVTSIYELYHWAEISTPIDDWTRVKVSK